MIKTKRIFALLLAIALCLSLAACGEDKVKTEVDGKSETVSVKDDPGEYLVAALNNTYTDLKERYGGSPAAVIGSALKGGSGALDLGFSIDGTQFGTPGKIGLDGKLYMNAKDMRYMLDAGVSYQGIKISGKVYFDKDFAGVSVPLLLGNDSFYGLKPHDLYDQASGSIFDGMLGSQLGLNIEEFKDIDAVLDILLKADFGLEDLIKDVMDASNDFYADLDYDVEKTKGSYLGKEKKGYQLSTTIEADDMAKLVDKMYKVMLESGYFKTLFELGDITGQDLRADIESQLASSIEEVRNSGVEMDVDYFITDGRVVSVSEKLTSKDSDGKTKIELDYYGSKGDTVSVELKAPNDNSLEAESVVEATKSGYKHTVEMTVTNDGDKSKISIDTDWDAKSGDYETELTAKVDGENVSISVSGELKQEDGGFELSDGTLKLSAPGAEKISFDFDLAFDASAKVPSVGDKINIFELSQDDLLSLIMAIQSAASSLGG